jgi:hypothetical protein
VDWPTTVREIRPGFKIYFIKRGAAPPPDGSGAAESPLPIQIQPPVSMRINNLSLIEVLYIFLQPCAAALEKHNIFSGV